MLTIHHLGISQSERALWLCEELEIPYKLVRYDRLPVIRAAPPEYKALHPVGTAPVIVDGELVLAESGAIVEYICAKHGGGRLIVPPSEPSFADYLFWFHFANGSMMPRMVIETVLAMAHVANDEMQHAFRKRVDDAFDIAEARLATAEYFAGNTLTAADIMMLFPLTTMRDFVPHDLSSYPNIRRYLIRIGNRPAYQRAFNKGDPGFNPLLA